jgi:hypothetical protein
MNYLKILGSSGISVTVEEEEIDKLLVTASGLIVVVVRTETKIFFN